MVLQIQVLVSFFGRFFSFLTAGCTRCLADRGVASRVLPVLALVLGLSWGFSNPPSSSNPYLLRLQSTGPSVVFSCLDDGFSTVFLSISKCSMVFFTTFPAMQMTSLPWQHPAEEEENLNFDPSEWDDLEVDGEEDGSRCGRVWCFPDFKVPGGLFGSENTWHPKKTNGLVNGKMNSSLWWFSF